MGSEMCIRDRGSVELRQSEVTEYLELDNAAIKYLVSLEREVVAYCLE